MKDISLYIHIPFCIKKCHYCDFLSYINKNDMIEKYMKFLIKEISFYKEKLREYTIKTIFIGGGTPSAIDEKYIEQVLAYIYSNFNASKSIEITIEINPGTLDYKKAKSYYKSGINRISLGVQTFNNNLLRDIGRIHKAEDIYNSFEILKTAGFNNINFDMIFGLPNQTRADIVKDLKILSRLDINHISYYSLIIEEGTPMALWKREGKLNLLNENVEREIYHYIIKILKDNEFNHYEISSFAKENFPCQHNSVYWGIKPYIGLGLNSHSNFMGQRFWNFSVLDDYFHQIDRGELPIEEKEIIDKDMEIAEYCIFGIRFIDGINMWKFKDRFGKEIKSIYGDVISKHIKNGLIVEDKDYIKLTKKGLDLANQVEIDFL